MRAVTALLALPLVRASDTLLGNSAVDVDVVIVGAGWAGMAAADHLHRAGVSFVVLEAQNHTGGRSHAFQFGHPSVGQFIFEQGSNWVCGSGTVRKDKDSPTVRTNRVLDLADLEGLQTAYIPGACDGNMSNYFMVYDESLVRTVTQLENCVRRVTTRWTVSIGLCQMPRTTTKRTKR